MKGRKPKVNKVLAYFQETGVSDTLENLIDEAEAMAKTLKYLHALVNEEHSDGLIAKADVAGCFERLHHADQVLNWEGSVLYTAMGGMDPDDFIDNIPE